MRYCLLIILLTTSLTTILAQTGIIRGKITDTNTGEPLIGVVASIVGTDIHTSSDNKGYYEFNKAPVGFQKLRFQSIGYETHSTLPFQVTVANPIRIDISMSPSITEVESVQVTGRSVRRLENPPIGLYKLNIQEIEKSPGGTRDISKVVQNLPGVIATPINRNDLMVRGGGPNENKFYLDRIEIPILNHFQTQGASGGNASLVNTDFLQAANLYTSAFPASRGNALSSVLDLRMKDGNSDKFKAKFAVGASDVSATFDTPLDEKTALIASYRVSYLQFLFSALKLPFLPTYQDAQFKFTRRFDERNKLTVIGLGSYDINRLNKSLGDLEPDRQQILDYLPENDQWSYVLGALFTHYTNNGSLDVIISTNRLNNSLQKWLDNDKGLPKSLDYKSVENEIKSRIEYNMSLGGGYTFNSGISADHGYYRNHTTRLIYKNAVAEPQQYRSRLSMMRYALYAAIDRGYFSNKLRLNLAIRFDANSYSDKMNNPLRQFSPRLSASWEFRPKWTMNANIGRYFQEPGYTTMGFRDSDNNLINRDRLRYIKSDQVSAGLAYNPTAEQRISVEGFYKHYTHYPMSMIDSTAIGSSGSDVFAVGDEPVVSSGRNRAYGVEFSYRNENLFGCLVNVAYTFYYSQFRKLDSDFAPTGNYIPTNWDNRHLLNIMVSRSFNKGWDVGFRWRFAGKAPVTPYDYAASSLIDVWQENKRPVADYSRINSERLPAFHQLDVRIDKTWYFNTWTLGLYVDIQNAYNYKAYGLDILMPEYSADGSYVVDPTDSKRYKLASYKNEVGGTTIPTFGIIVEF